MKSYLSIPALSAVVLEESWVLRIEATPGVVTFYAEFVLTPEHPEYAPPTGDEQFSYLVGRLSLRGIRELSWRNQGAPPARDANNEEDLGHIDVFEWSRGRFQVGGDWGQMTVLGETISVTLSE